MALTMAAILYLCGRNYKIITLFLYFASMEALQYFQYDVIDQARRAVMFAAAQWPSGPSFMPC